MSGFDHERGEDFTEDDADVRFKESGGDYPHYLDRGGKLSRIEWEAAGYPEPFDTLSFIMGYEGGELDEDEITETNQPTTPRSTTS